MPHVVYHRNYNIGFYGLERLHPFDSRKYGKAWRAINRLESGIGDTDDGILDGIFHSTIHALLPADDPAKKYGRSNLAQAPRFRSRS